MAYFIIPVPPLPPESIVRPSEQTLVDALNTLDVPLIKDDELTLSVLQQILRQWNAALMTADVAELAGLADDLRELDERLAANYSWHEQQAALHRVGLSLERVAVWGQAAGLTSAMQALGRRLLQVAAGASPTTAL